MLEWTSTGIAGGERLESALRPARTVQVLASAEPYDARARTAPRLRFGSVYSFTALNRAAFPMTLTDDSAIAAAAMIGESRMPKVG
jgi:hypothetical protein